MDREHTPPQEAPFALRSPHPRLSSHVVAYLGHDYTTTGPTSRRLTALGSVLVVIDLDDVDRRQVPGSPAPATSSPVSGLSDRAMTFEPVGRERGVVVEMTPLGARALFGLPLRELANTSVDLADLLGGPQARRLAEQLAAAKGWEARFQLLDDQLTTWMLDGPRLDRPVHGAWHQLVLSSGRTRIGALADQIGWTRQHLNARFHDQIGLSPKTVSRIARFHQAIRMTATPNPPSWSEIAAACGYADQPHLNLDFRALAGCTPTELTAFDGSRGEIFIGSRLSMELLAATTIRRTA